jgi:hypothetical protein
MANVGGFDFTSPLEVQTKMNELITQMRGSGDPNKVNAANSQQFITGLFGSPESRQAQKTEKGLTSALGSVQKRQEETEAAFQVRQQTAVRDQMATIDPKVAIQANDNIIALQSEALSQKRLGLQIDTLDFELENALQTSVDAKTPNIMRIDSNGQVQAVKTLDPEATSEEIEAERARFQALDPESQYTVGSGLDRLKLEDLEFNSTGGLNKSALRKIEESLEGSAELMFGGAQFLRKGIENPASLTPTSGSVAAGAGLVAGIRRIAGEFVGSDAEATQDATRYNRVAGGPEAIRRIESMGIQSGIARGLILNMAYTLAKTLDPGGRLSDQDVEMAISMLAGTGNPGELKELLRFRFEAAAEAAKTHKTRALGGGLNGQIGVEKYQDFQRKRDILFGLLDDFDEIIDGGGLAAMNPGAYGRTRNKKTTEPASTDGPSARDRLKARLNPQG